MYNHLCEIKAPERGRLITNILAYKPGEDNHLPGARVEVCPCGGAIHNPSIVHIDSGDRLPPTQESLHLWRSLSSLR
ncbi:MAG: YjzC family protein [Scardovia wiggsiae]|uniref:YjzC family protein n=1 Tax=Scardovia wiggsiae TaxID=230143 RepID=UPI0022773B24|nr:YjzC family protein [Scardovia wiggsiae]